MMKKKNKNKNCTIKTRPRRVPLASARQRPENQKENQAGHSSERTVEDHFRARMDLPAEKKSLRFWLISPTPGK